MQRKIAILALLLLPSQAMAADNTPPCLSREQAKAKYPGAHLYWHTINRCWDNIPVTRGRRVYAPPIRLPIEKPVIEPPEPEPHRSSIFYPDLMPGAPPAPAMLSPEPATRWLFTDFDEMFAPFVEWNARISGQFR